MIRQGILIAGIIGYFFAISELITAISNIVTDADQENLTKSFLRVIDDDDNGVISQRELAGFNENACKGYDGKRLNKEFKPYGKKADLNALASLLSPKIGNRKNYVVLTSIEGCVKDLEQVVDPEVIKGLPADKLSKTYMKAYDLDSNQQIKWAEFNLANQFLKKSPVNTRQLFTFFDRNKDWKISKKELEKAKTKTLVNYLGLPKPKK